MLSTLALKYCHQILYDPKFLIRKEFKFKKLPIIVRMLIIQLMDPAERFALSLTSKRMKIEVRLVKNQSYYFQIIFRKGISYIQLRGVTGFEVICNSLGYKRVVGGYHWLQYKKGTLIESTALALNKMSSVFNMDGLGMFFTKVTPSLIRLKNIFSNDTFKLSWDKITLHEIELSSEMVTFFLNMADFHKKFTIFKCDMPLDFKHENAFKFGTTEYLDARWVTLNDILKIRDVENVSLYRTTLTSDHVRFFISSWINSTVDMFEYLSIRAMETIQLGGLFNELIVLEHHADPLNIGYFTLAKSTSRQFKLLLIFHEVDAVALSAWKPYDVLSEGNIDEKFKNVYEIMELLEKKNTSEKELEETRDVTKRREYRDQIQESERKIHELGVVYRDGRATI